MGFCGGDYYIGVNNCVYHLRFSFLSPIRGDKVVYLFICPFMFLLGRKGLNVVQSALCVQFPFCYGKRDGLFADNGPRKQIECGIGTDAKLLTKIVELFLDVRVKAD